MLVAITPNALELIEDAGRVCYQSRSSKSEYTAINFVQNLIRNHHMSVLEHASATVDIVTDRGISHELVRHRIASYSQESTRYCKYDDAITVINPNDCRITPLLTTAEFAAWKEAMEQAAYSYMKLRDSGASPQIARQVLPISLKTEIVMTANFREWLHFLHLRTHTSAHPMMQSLAYDILDLLFTKCPTIFNLENIKQDL